MRLKSYFASTVEAALTMAQKELGPDAMLVDSHRTNFEARHLGEYEVICGLMPASTDSSRDEDFTSIPQPFRAPNLDKLSQEVSELKRYMERMALTISKSSAGFANLRSKPELAEAFARLTANEVDPMIAHDIITSIGEGARQDSNVEALLGKALDRIFSVDPSLGRTGSSRAIVALAGPPGAGKTTCLVKLAALYGLATRKPAQILTLDTIRVAAADQLRSYAAILGIGFQVIETTSGLAQALEEHRNKDLILIDTPGFGRNEMENAQDIARYLGSHPDIETHLVLPISAKPADLKRTVNQYEVFRPAKLLFTRTDETNTYGSMLNLAIQTGKPVSFVSSGQQIPEDLAPASKDVLVDLILKRDCLEEALTAAVAAA
jgi:flagellar biosynthesis protein FlhF